MANGYDEVSHADTIGYTYQEKAKEIIFKEKVEMCFNHLFPNIRFDEDELKEVDDGVSDCYFPFQLP